MENKCKLINVCLNTKALTPEIYRLQHSSTLQFYQHYNHTLLYHQQHNYTITKLFDQLEHNHTFLSEKL